MNMGRVVGVGTEGPLLQRQYLTRLFAVVAALILVFTPVRTDSEVTMYTLQLKAMQAIGEKWYQSTPDPAINLARWNSSEFFPCKENHWSLSWRGVQCVENINCTEYGCNAYIIGLILNNASIVGILPPAIGNIDTLSTLELTGNPNLTGPLPQEIQDPYLHILDLHDNGFSGILPDMPDLFTVLNVHKLSRNQFSGNLPSDAFVYKTELESLDLSVNRFGGAVPVLSKCKRLQSLILSNNSFNGSLPDLTEFTSLRTLKLDYNNLTGVFPSCINGSVVNNSLSILDLSGNQLTGSVTNWHSLRYMIHLEELYIDNTRIGGILDVTKLIESELVRSKLYRNRSHGLRVLSMMNNDITDVLYKGKIVDIATFFRLKGNPYCLKTADDATRCFCEQYCNDEGVLNNKKVITIAAAASSASVVVIVAIVVTVLLYRAQRYKQNLLRQVNKKFEEFGVKPTIYSYNELRAATRDFHPDTKLGEGGYGAVYMGTLPNQSMVAVKNLFVKSNQGMDDFLNEVVLITGMKHRNLVNLKGCCVREQQRLLVYEYVDNYDIDQILLRGEHKTSLSWALRHNICLGVARGLHYLHTLAHPKIIHRDIKASNVLLDKNFEPKIADFGLALLFPDEQSHITTIHVLGTKGYLAPEYASLGQLSEKVDVYSFGVLCFEILSGRRNIDELMPPDQIYLPNWAWNLHAGGNLMDLVDQSMILAEDERREVRGVINIALLCCQDAAEQRPTMARVVAMLQHDTESEVVVLNSGKKERHLDTMHLLELTTISETNEAETSTFSSCSQTRIISR